MITIIDVTEMYVLASAACVRITAVAVRQRLIVKREDGETTKKRNGRA